MNKEEIRDLATKVYNGLNLKGAELGNASINIINDTLTESLTEPKANEEVVLDKIMGVIDTHVSNYNQITLEREIEKVLTTQRVTDEEITKASKELCLDSLKQSMFRKGAKWLRDKK